MSIARQKKNLRARLEIAKSARQLERIPTATVELMCVLARACGHDAVSGFAPSDRTTRKRAIADLTGVAYAGVGR